MFNKYSLKTKIIIFLIAAVAATALIINTAINNRQNTKNYKFGEESPSVTNGVIKANESSSKEKEEAEKKKQEEALKQEKQKALEDKYQKGYVAFQNKNYGDAIKLEDEVIKEDDKFYKAYNVKGIAQCYNKKYLEGMNNIDKALEIKPEYGYARFNKALAFELYAKYDDALKWYDKALEVENFVWSYYGKASIYGRRGDVSNTVKNLKTAIDMDAAVKDVAKDEVDFNNVKNSKEFQEILK
jgi:tetratricopeptide (TPR) repeat protein